MRDLDRLKVIQALVDGNLKPAIAAQRLQMTVRQVRRLASRFRIEGPAGLISRRCNRPSNNRMPADLTALALDIIRDRYADFGPTLACEKLRECHGLPLSKETVRNLVSEAGLRIPRKLRTASIYQPRNRRHRPSATLKPPRPTWNATTSRRPFTATRPAYSGVTRPTSQVATAIRSSGELCTSSISRASVPTAARRKGAWSVPTWPCRIAWSRKYDKTIYLLADTRQTHKLIGKYIDVFAYPDGRIELRVDGAALPYTTYDLLPAVDQGAIVENKRLF